MTSGLTTYAAFATRNRPFSPLLVLSRWISSVIVLSTGLNVSVLMLSQFFERQRRKGRPGCIISSLLNGVWYIVVIQSCEPIVNWARDNHILTSNFPS
jgi:hypothetical protein